MTNMDTRDENHADVATWYDAITDLLPGPRFVQCRQDILDWWRRVLQVSDINILQRRNVEAKEKFLLYSKKLSEAYRVAVSASVSDVDVGHGHGQGNGHGQGQGQRAAEEIKKWTSLLHSAGHEVSSDVLKHLFHSG